MIAHSMADQWIIRVQDKDYGPADLHTLREWKREGRVIAQNPARHADLDPAAGVASEEALWITAAEIPGLFDVAATLPAAGEPTQILLQHPRHSFVQILGETLRIYRKGFFQFLYLTLLVALPSICAQLSGSAVGTSPGLNPDLRTAIAAAFTLCMLLLSLAVWPIFIAGIQILTAELAAGREARIFGLFHQVLKYWPRVAMLCVFVYGSYAFWTLLLLGFVLGIALSSLGLAPIFISLLLLAFWVWIIGRIWVNFLFWQQFAVLTGSDAGAALRQSKELARSRRDLPWYQRPMWRGVFIASLWCAFVLVLNAGQISSALELYFHNIATATDPQAMLQALRASPPSQGFDLTNFAFGLLQTLLRPLLGIAFVLLYFDSRSGDKMDL
jgi:hypothetical protein